MTTDTVTVAIVVFCLFTVIVVNLNGAAAAAPLCTVIALNLNGQLLQLLLSCKLGYLLGIQAIKKCS